MEKIPHRQEFDSLLEKQEKEKEELKEKAHEEAIPMDENINKYEETKKQIEEAIEVLGKEDVLGPEAIKEAVDIELKPEEVPTIPFSKEDLEKAKELNQFLILRVDADFNEKPITISKIQEMYKDEFGEFKFNAVGMLENANKEDTTLNKNWALVSKEPIPGSEGEKYGKQTELLVDYLTDKVFENKELPKEYKEAIDEIEETFKPDKDGYALMVGNEQFSNFKLNKLTRQTPAEVLYDVLAYYKINKEPLLKDSKTWTSGYNKVSDEIYDIGRFNSDDKSVNINMHSHDWSPSKNAGVMFSRTL